jgi:hypothetical protein
MQLHKLYSPNRRQCTDLQVGASHLSLALSDKMSILRAARPRRRLFSSTAVFSNVLKPPQPPKLIEDSTSALDYKRSQRIRPPPLPETDLPRSRTAEEAVTNILYNTPPPSLQPFKKYSDLFALSS